MSKFRKKTPKRERIKVEKYEDGFYNLRENFNYKCGYCDTSDKYLNINNFEIDHFAPKSKFPELKNEYKNLIYSCKNCNRFKSNYWATSKACEPINDGKGFLDPCSNKYGDLFFRNNRGYILPIDDNLAKFIYRRLKLYLFKRAFYYKLEEYQEKVEKIMNHNNCEILESELLIEIVKMNSKIPDLINTIELDYKLKN